MWYPTEKQGKAISDLKFEISEKDQEQKKKSALHVANSRWRVHIDPSGITFEAPRGSSTPDPVGKDEIVGCTQDDNLSLCWMRNSVGMN
jgi:hypothetical protein